MEKNNRLMAEHVATTILHKHGTEQQRMNKQQKETYTSVEQRSKD